MELADSFRIRLERCEPNIPKLKNKNEQGGPRSPCSTARSFENQRTLARLVVIHRNPPLRAVFPTSEAAPGRIGFFCQVEKDLHDPGVLICRGVEKQPVINEALDRGHRSALFCGSWSDDR